MAAHNHTLLLFIMYTCFGSLLIHFEIYLIPHRVPFAMADDSCILSSSSTGSDSHSRRSGLVAPSDVPDEKRPFIERKNAKAVNNKKHKRSYKYKRDKLVSKLEPGDHIAARRTLKFYEHHGIYEGEEKGYPSVIHFQGPLEWFHKLSRSQSCINKCGYEHPMEGKVVTSCIDCFSQRKSMFKMQYMLQENFLYANDSDRNELKTGKLIKGYRSKKCYLEYHKNGQLHGHSIVPTKKGKRSKLDSQVRFYPEFSNRTSEEVLQVAREYKPPEYSLVCNNCEHFAVNCKIGKSMSKQSQRCNAEKRLCENGKRKRCCMSISKNGFEKLTPEAKRRKR